MGKQNDHLVLHTNSKMVATDIDKVNTFIPFLNTIATTAILSPSNYLAAICFAALIYQMMKFLTHSC